jgi:hypothetical protein
MEVLGALTACGTRGFRTVSGMSCDEEVTATAFASS